MRHVLQTWEQLWIVEYNHLLDKYNTLANLNITHMSFNTHDLSSTQKTVRNTTIEFFLNNLSNLIRKLESDIEANRLKMAEKKDCTTSNA